MPVRTKETIDFSFGWDVGQMTTNLKMRYWDNSSQQVTAHRCIGSTYELVPGGDGEILVDRGFLLAEELRNGRVLIRTLKQVRFAHFTPAVDLACSVWKYAGPLMWRACR